MAEAHGAKSSLRKEDPALLSGRGRYADDLPVPVGTLHAHVIRSPHAHADIKSIDVTKAMDHPGVWAVITGDEVRKRREKVTGRVLALERTLEDTLPYVFAL